MCTGQNDSAFALYRSRQGLAKQALDALRFVVDYIRLLFSQFSVNVTASAGDSITSDHARVTKLWSQWMTPLHVVNGLVSGARLLVWFCA